jgi:hypothetical protein
MLMKMSKVKVTQAAVSKKDTDHPGRPFISKN